MTHYNLELRYSTSRGAETHGWTICSLYNALSNKKLTSCRGGGYDMRGTVLGIWMEKTFQEQLKSLNPADFYGMFKNEKGVHLDGGCGWESMRAILEAIGYQIRNTKLDKNGNLVCFLVEAK